MNHFNMEEELKVGYIRHFLSFSAVIRILYITEEVRGGVDAATSDVCMGVSRAVDMYIRTNSRRGHVKYVHE